jgi:glycogen synthase
MRILVLSNFYPPLDRGGFEQSCHEVCTSLAARGHEIAVLTSHYQANEIHHGEQRVYRVLHLESDLHHYQPWEFFFARRKRDAQNLQHLIALLRDFQPDVFFVWGMWNLSWSLPAYVEQHEKIPVVYWLSDLWPIEPDVHTTFWSQPARQQLLQMPRKILSKIAFTILKAEGKPVKLRFQRLLCVSDAVYQSIIDSGIPLHETRVIHHGIDVGLFSPNHNGSGSRQEGFRVIYAGALAPHKCVHTAIEALAHLVHERQMEAISLTLVGAGHPDYEDHLQELVARHNLQQQVFFHGRVPHEAMATLLHQFDCLVFPSVWEEPIGRSHIEAMASGLAVVSTPTGGSKEVMTDGVNGLTFPPGDALALANHLECLMKNPSFARQLAESGRQTVVEHFALDKWVSQIEQYLLGVVEKNLCELG